MKIILSIAGIALLVINTVQAGSMEIIKQRAKELNNQNNVRQGVGAPTAAAPAAAPTAKPGQPLPPDPVAKIRTDIAALLDSSTVSTEVKQQFTRDLLTAARGSHKPTTAALGQLTDSLAGALSGKTLDTTAQARLAASLNLALNSASLPASRTDEIAADVQAILQVAGATRGAAVAAANQLKTVCAELQSAAGQ